MDSQEPQQNRGLLADLKEYYYKNYKKLLIIPIVLLILAIIQIGFQISTTGDFVNKDVSLKGGLTLTIPTDGDIDIDALEANLKGKYPDKDISIRSFSTGAESSGIIITSDLDGTDKQELDAFLDSIRSFTNLALDSKDYSLEVFGSTLGESFFREAFKALISAFLLMGLVVFLYFGEKNLLKLIIAVLTIIAIPVVFSSNNSLMYALSFIIIAAMIYIYIKYSVPSFAVVLAAFSDIVITLAVINILNIKLSTAGIAAFLMLIGYSVDTDILLSTRLLKRKEGTFEKRLFGAISTGLTMTLTTIAAVIAALIFSQSNTITQIMTILLIGLCVDIINTWIQNIGILRLYIERKTPK